MDQLVLMFTWLGRDIQMENSLIEENMLITGAQLVNLKTLHGTGIFQIKEIVQIIMPLT